MPENLNRPTHNCKHPGTMNRTTLTAIITIFGMVCLIAGITCMSLEIPAAGVPLIILFLASSFCFLERNCARWKPLTPHPPPELPSRPPEHTAIPVQPTADTTASG